jgi:mRNA interferase MazF
VVDFEGKHRVKRGEVWTIAGGPDYVGKPRPAIIVQSDKFDVTRSITVCPLTGTEVDADPARFAIDPSQANGLGARSHAMVDKISTLPKSKLGRHLGQLDANDLSRLNRHVTLFLGLVD